MSVPIFPRRRKLYKKGKATNSATPSAYKECPFCGKKGHAEDNCWKKHHDKAHDRRVKDEVHYQERRPLSPKREVKEEASSSQGMILFGTHFMDYNSTFIGHIDQTRSKDSTIDAMELRSSTVHQRDFTPRQDPVDEEGRQNKSRQPLSFSPQVSSVHDPLETSASRELLSNKMNNKVLASVAGIKMQISLSCAMTDVTPEAIKKIATEYINGNGHAIPDTPLARVVSTFIAKVVLSLPLRDLYLHDGHFQLVISTSFATEHGIDLRRAYGVFLDNLLLDHTMEHICIYNTYVKGKRQRSKTPLSTSIIYSPTTSVCRVDTLQGDFVMLNGQPMKDIAIDSCCSTALIRPLAALSSTDDTEEMPSNINTTASEAVRCCRSKTFDTLTFRRIDVHRGRFESVRNTSPEMCQYY